MLLAADRVVSVDLPEAVVTERRCGQAGADFRAQICDHGHFFASPAAAGGWAAEHPGGEVHTVRDAFGRCRAACRQVGWLTHRATAPAWLVSRARTAAWRRRHPVAGGGSSAGRTAST